MKDQGNFYFCFMALNYASWKEAPLLVLLPRARGSWRLLLSPQFKLFALSKKDLSNFFRKWAPELLCLH